MKTIRTIIFVTMLICCLLPACVPSPAEQAATATLAAANSFATLTTQAPAATATHTPAATATATPTLAPTNTPAPTATPVPTASPTLTPTATATPLPRLTVKSALPLQAGPSLQYPQTGSLKKGEAYALVGQSDHCRWLQVSDQKAINGWIRNEGNAVELQAPCENIPPGTYRPATGLLISVQGTRGWNQIRIDNAEKLDAVFILIDTTNQLIVSAYVRNGEKFTMSKIYDGLYYLFFTTGTDWNGTIFTRDARYHRYAFQFDFYTTGASKETDWYYTYRVYNANLPEKAGLTMSIPADQFPKPYK